MRNKRVEESPHATVARRAGQATARMALFVALIVAALGVIAPSPRAQPSADTAPTADRPLKVAVRVVPPFVFTDNGALTGFSIDLWNAIARELGRPSEFVVKGPLPELLEEAGSGRADAAIAAISITAAREQRYDFSQPMFDSGLQILVSSDRATSGSKLPGLFHLLASGSFLELMGLLLLLMIIPVPLIWFLERRGHPDFVRSKTRHGEFFKSMWWSASTLVGQATEMPYTFLGRVVAVLWMLIGVVFVSYFTATVTASLTVQQLEQSISGPSDLVGKRVATVKGSTAAAYLRTLNIDPLEFDRFDEAAESLTGGRADAVVYDSPVLLHYAAHEGRGRVQTAGAVFRSEYYGILFQRDSHLRKEVNEALLKLRESGEYRTLYRKWFTVEAVDG